MTDLEKAPPVMEMESTNDLKQVKTIDTLHNDEAVKVLNTYDGETDWTDEEEKKLRRKIDLRLMPVLCLTYGLQYYDKAMLGQAALFGLITDLGLEGERYSWSAAIFYLGFIIGAYPVMYLAQRLPTERVASVTVTIWGVCLILTTACKNYQGLYAQRFFLGVLESGVSPMFMLVVGSFYRKNEQALRMGIWYCCTGYVSCVSPLINFGLGQINGGVDSWRYMYFFSGAITIAWGIAVWWVLPPDPVRARGFNERERYIMVARLRSNNSGVRNTHFKGSQIVELLLDPKFWLMFSIATLCMIANGAISTFLPIIIDKFGFSTVHSLLLIIPAGVYAGSMMLIFSWLSMRFKNIRSYLFILGQLGTTLGCLLLWKLPTTAVGGLLFACYILPSVGAGYAVLMGLQLANIAGYTKRSFASSGLYIGYSLGNFIGPLVFRASDAPRYPHAFMCNVGAALGAALLVAAYRALCIWQNRKRDREGIREGYDHAYEDDLTDLKNPQFRYIL